MSATPTLKPQWFQILLAVADHELHGLGIMKEVLEQTDGQMRLWPAMLYGSLKKMVDADLGITFLPEIARGSSLLKNTRVKMYPLDDKSFRTIGLVWRKGSGRGEEFQLLGDFIRRQHKKVDR